MVNPFMDIINTGGGAYGKAMSNGRGRPLFTKWADETFLNNNNCGDDNDNGCKRKERDNANDGNNDAGKKWWGGVPTSGTTNKTNHHQKNKFYHWTRYVMPPLWIMAYVEQLDIKMREMVN
jgi:hypothetical protein